MTRASIVGLVVLLLLTVAVGLSAESPPLVQSNDQMYMSTQSAANAGIPDVAIQYQNDGMVLERPQLLNNESMDNYSQPAQSVLTFTSETERRAVGRSARDWVKVPATQNSYI